ncbi:hypothetical protein FO675_10305 [Riemerella anatipestifer]|nr:hypothetical protein [Riemerella anatipestifer]
MNNFPLASVRGIWHLAHAKFCFHKYSLEVRLFHKLNWLFGFRASSVQKGYFARSVLAFPLVLCVLRGERRFLIGSRVQGLKFKYSRGKGSRVQSLKFKYSRLNKRTYPLTLKHRTLNSFSSLNFKLFYNFTISQPNNLTIIN